MIPSQRIIGEFGEFVKVSGTGSSDCQCPCFKIGQVTCRSRGGKEGVEVQPSKS